MNTFHKVYKATRIWIILILALIFPQVITKNSTLYLACLSLMYAILTVSLNVLSGFSGLMSVGQRLS